MDDRLSKVASADQSSVNGDIIGKCLDAQRQLVDPEVFKGVKDSLISVSQSLSKMSDSSLSDSAIKLTIISAVSAAAAAFVFNLIQWKITKRRERREAFEKGILDQLSRLRDDLMIYWMRSQKSDKVANAISEMNIKSDLKTLDRLIKLYYETFPPLRVPKNKGEVDLLYSDLFDIATGEDFESQNRAASPQTARQVSGKIADIRVRVISSS